MVTTAASVEWTVVNTEVEALQLEYSWIKEFDPRFNVKYRDDKSYPYLAVTMGEDYPRVMVMRGAKRKGTRYFGPYSHAWVGGVAGGAEFGVYVVDDFAEFFACALADAQHGVRCGWGVCRGEGLGEGVLGVLDVASGAVFGGVVEGDASG